MALISGGFLTLHISLYYMTHHGRVDILTNDDFFCHVAITAKQNKHSNTYTKKSTLTFKPTFQFLTSQNHLKGMFASGKCLLKGKSWGLLCFVFVYLLKKGMTK